MNRQEPGSIVVGVDVGGPKKGFHAVALRDGQCREPLSTLRETQGTGSLFPSRSPRFGVRLRWPCCQAQSDYGRLCVFDRYGSLNVREYRHVG
jgi:hypothetical protein